MRFSRDGERLIVDLEPPGDNDPSDTFDPTAGRVEVWDWRDGEIVTTIDVLPWVAVPSPTSDLVAISPHIQARDQSLKVWNTVTGQPVATLAGHTGAVYDMAFSADGTRLATAGGDGTIRIWDPESGAHLLTLDGHIGAIVSGRVQPRRHAARHGRHGRHRPGLGARPRRVGRDRRAARHPRLHRRRMRALPADAVLQMTRPAVGFAAT